MAIEKKRMMQRRTTYAGFNPADNLDGEFTVVTSGDPAASDGRSLYVSFAPGRAKRMAAYEDMVDNIDNATEEVQKKFAEEMQTAIDNADTVIDSGNTMITNAQSAIQSADAATKKANDAAEEAKKYVLGDISSKTVAFSEASIRANIASGENTATLFGKIKKHFSESNLKTYTTLAQLGNAPEKPTMVDIWSNWLTDNSYLIIDTNMIDSPPTTTGVIEVVRLNTNRGYARCTEKAGNSIYYMYLAQGTSVLSGTWRLVSPVNNLTTTTAGSPLDATMGPTITTMISNASKTVFKGGASDLNALIKEENAWKVFIHAFAAGTTGNPNTGSGFVITHYHNVDNVSQWTYHLNGGKYHRQRLGSNIGSWVIDTPVTNLTATVAGSPLDATMGKALNDDIQKSSFYTLLNSGDLDVFKGENYVQHYYAPGSNTCTNKPSGVDNFELEVKRVCGGIWVQRISVSTNLGVEYVRRYSSGVWTSWTKQEDKETFSLTLASGFTAEYISAFRIGSQVTINFGILGSYDASSHIKIAGLPAAFRPAGTIYSAGHSGIDGPLQIRLDKDGSLYSWGNVVYSVARGTLTYII